MKGTCIIRSNCQEVAKSHRPKTLKKQKSKVVKLIVDLPKRTSRKTGVVMGERPKLRELPFAWYQTTMKFRPRKRG